MAHALTLLFFITFLTGHWGLGIFFVVLYWWYVDTFGDPK